MKTRNNNADDKKAAIINFWTLNNGTPMHWTLIFFQASKSIYCYPVDTGNKIDIYRNFG